MRSEFGLQHALVKQERASSQLTSLTTLRRCWIWLSIICKVKNEPPSVSTYDSLEDLPRRVEPGGKAFIKTSTFNSQTQNKKDAKSVPESAFHAGSLLVEYFTIIKVV